MKTFEEKLYQIFLTSNGVCIDSRKADAGFIFFAFEGEHTDGHKYVEKVLQHENAYCVIDNPDYDNSERTLLVENTLECLQNLARRYRDDMDFPVLGITGSNGKTTTKELIMAVLSCTYQIHYTRGNYNNHIGVPLTILDTPREGCDILIVEMGANKIGDIEELCSIANPTHGLITNIGTAHIEGFGSQENILIGKTEMYRHLEDHDGIIFINKNDEKLLSKLPSNIELVLYPNNETEASSNGLFLELKDQNTGKVYPTSLYGEYNAINMHAAIAIGDYFDVERDQALTAISKYQAEMNRSQIVHIDKRSLILDAYNANPTSMAASIQSLERFVTERPKMLVLGDMFELGEDELMWHKHIIEQVSNSKWGKVILVGDRFDSADNDRLFEHASDINELVNQLQKNPDTIPSNAVILIKGSRSMQLEKVLQVFE